MSVKNQGDLEFIGFTKIGDWVRNGDNGVNYTVNSAQDIYLKIRSFLQRPVR